MYFTMLTFVVILVWIGLTVYRNLRPAEPTQGIVVVPIEDSFDFETVEKLKGRVVIPVDFSANPVSTPSPTISTTPEVNTVEIEFIPIASSSGIPATSSAQ